MTRADWLAWRRDGLGGSDVAAILGIEGAYSSPWDVWLSKMGDHEERPGNAAMSIGSRLEAPILDYAEEHLGQLARDVRIEHPAEPWRRGTVDALRMLEGQNVVVVEAKMDGGYSWDEIPEHYKCQVLWYACILDALGTPIPVHHIQFSVFHRRAPALRLYTLERDPEFEAHMIDTARAWWQAHIVEGKPPIVDYTKACSIGLERTRKRTDEHRIASAAEVEMCGQYDALSDAVAILKQDRDYLGNQIKHAIGNAAGLQWTGGRATYSRSLRVRIDKGNT